MKKNILVVDDEKDIIDLLSYNLIKEGFAVITARNGREALERVKQKPDLIILDIMMPEINGLQVIQELKGIRRQRPFLCFYLQQRVQRQTKLSAWKWERMIISLSR
jgi:two-component system alkaline phosphatase synthesis response regulator PhoP